LNNYLRYVCSLPNPGAAGQVRELFSDNEEEVAAFAKRQDGPDRGIYDCVGLFALGTTRRNKETVIALPKLVVDLDLKNMDHDRETVLATLRKLPAPPSEIRDSGFGLHALWWLKEPLVGDDIDRGEEAMRRLVRLLAADPAPTHRAALLRRPGTTNTKGGGNRPCYVIEGDPQRVYDITEIEDTLDLYDEREPLLHYKPSADGAARTAERAAPAYSGPVDVEARLAAMRFEGPGESSIHENFPCARINPEKEDETAI
jgi:putative DNA primase/helicase